MKHTKKQIRQLRKDLDRLDLEIMELVKKRLVISKKIGIIKRKAGIAVKQGKREGEAMNLRLNRAKKLKINQTFMKKLFQLIFEQSRLEQHVIHNAHFGETPRSPSRRRLFDRKVKNC